MKFKLNQLLREVSVDAFMDALATAKPKYKNKTKEELAEIFGLTEYQFTHLLEKTIPNAMSEKLEGKIKETLNNGDSLEVPQQFNVYVHESKVRVKKETGKKSRKLSIKTRDEMKRKLNQ